jgi:hypothetical protein
MNNSQSKARNEVELDPYMFLPTAAFCSFRFILLIGSVCALSRGTMMAQLMETRDDPANQQSLIIFCNNDNR